MLIIRLTNTSLEPIPFVECVNGAQTKRLLAPGKCGFLRTLQFHSAGSPGLALYHGYGFGAFLRDGNTVMILFPRQGDDHLADRIAIEVIPMPPADADRASLCPPSGFLNQYPGDFAEATPPPGTSPDASSGFITFHTTEQDNDPS